MNKLHNKDFSIAFKTGTDANKSKFKKECVQGEIYHATDTGFFYVAEVTAGASDATLSKFGGAAFPNTYSIDLDGTDDYVDVNSSGDLGTVSIWFKPTTTTSSTSVDRCLIGFSGIAQYQNYAAIYIGNYQGGNDVYGLFDGDWGYFHSSTTTTLSNTDWHHLVVHWSGTDYELYLNGGSNSKNTEQNYFATAKAKRPYSILKIGEINLGAQEPYDGLIDEVAIWHNPLSSAELAGLYNGGVPTDLAAIGNSGAGPNGWWRMGDNDGGTGSTITDQGSGGNDGTLTNGPTFSTTVPS